jgi:thymidylate synthase ThyX
MDVELLALTRYLAGDGTPAGLLEAAGRVCYRSAPRGDPAGFVMKRVAEGHESIIEHLRFIFLVRGVSDADLLEAYQAAQGIGLTRRPDAVLLSLNARSLRDMARRRRTELTEALLARARQVCPAVFQDI